VELLDEFAVNIVQIPYKNSVKKDTYAKYDKITVCMEEKLKTSHVGEGYN